MESKYKTNYIKQVVDKQLAPQDEATEEWNSIEESVKEKFSGLSEEEQDKKVAKDFSNIYRAQANSGLTTYEGVILLNSGKQFITQRRIANIMTRYKKNPKQAIADGEVKIIDGVPTAVDNKKYFKEGTPNQRENYNYEKPLDGSNAEKQLKGVVR